MIVKYKRKCYSVKIQKVFTTKQGLKSITQAKALFSCKKIL